FQLSNGLLSSAPVSQATKKFGYPGGIPSISANGSNNGIVWSLQVNGYANSNPAVLYAYDAQNLATELYRSNLFASHQFGGAVKSTVPTIANGHVYVGTQGSVAVFGLLPSQRPLLTTLSPNTGIAGGPAFTLTVNGINFVPSSVVQWNGAARPTTFVSSTRI